MANEACDLLHDILAELRAIKLMIETRTAKRPPSKRSRMGRLVAEAQETLEEQATPKRVVELWAELCPSCAQPVEMTADRRHRARVLWNKFGGEAGVRNLFLTVADNDWLCGRPVKGSGRNIVRRSIGLFEVCDHYAEILEGTYR